MSMEEFDAKSCIVRRFKPCCVVFSSSLASSMCEENGLMCVEFLQPFFDLSKEQILFNKEVLQDFVIELHDFKDYLISPESQYKQRKSILLLNPPIFTFDNVLSLFILVYEGRNERVETKETILV